MDARLLEKLTAITDEEMNLIHGNGSIDRTLYYSPNHKGRQADEVDSARVLQNGRLIDIRRHVRFVRFPRHTHNFVEFIYMCKGSTTHIVDGQEILLREGDLLFLNQHAVQEILPASMDDIAVNFMILPAFFDTAFRMIGREESALRDFVVSCLTEQGQQGNYLYFDVASILPVQNLIENLIWNMLRDEPSQRSLNEVTMGLLFMNLMNYTDRIQVSQNSSEQELVLRLLRYIDTSYKNAALADFSAQCGYDVYTISRIIKKSTGRTFKELLQIKRLNQACFLLKNTKISIADIAESVGYDNTSFFHRLFRRVYEQSPKEYRDSD